MSKKFLTGVDLANQRAVNLADGSAPTDAVTKQQLDAAIRGLDWKQSVRAATTANITLSGTQTVDGVALSANDRVLVKDQSTGSQNGIFTVNSGSWSRAVDADENAEVTPGLTVTVEQGTVNGDKAFTLITDGPITVGTTTLAFSVLGGGGPAYTGTNGVVVSGTTISGVAKAGGGLQVAGDGFALDPAVAARRYSVDVPAGSTTAAIDHGLGTKDVIVGVREVSTGEAVMVDDIASTVNRVLLTFGTSPTSGQYRVTVVG